MPVTGTKVRFKSGTRANYDGLADKDQNTIYFITDEQRLFLGDVEYCQPGSFIVDYSDIYVDTYIDGYTHIKSEQEALLELTSGKNEFAKIEIDGTTAYIENY